MNVDFLGVFTVQAGFLLLASIVVVTILALVALWEIALVLRVCNAARRVVLQQTPVPVRCQSQPVLESALLSESLVARAPPTFRSQRKIDTDCDYTPSGSGCGLPR